MAARKLGFSSQNTAKRANINIGHTLEISSSDIFLARRVFVRVCCIQERCNPRS